MISIQFPDPHFKTKHKKRRVVKEDFVDAVAKTIRIGTKIFLQSDVIDVIEDMVETFAAHPEFTPVEGYSMERLVDNTSPVAVKTEREKATLARELPVYRMLFVKK